MSDSLTFPSLATYGLPRSLLSFSPMSVGNPNYRLWFLLENGNIQVGLDKIRSRTLSRCPFGLTTGFLVNSPLFYYSGVYM